MTPHDPTRKPLPVGTCTISKGVQCHHSHSGILSGASRPNPQVFWDGLMVFYQNYNEVLKPLYFLYLPLISGILQLLLQLGVTTFDPLIRSHWLRLDAAVRWAESSLSVIYQTYYMQPAGEILYYLVT
jgi:hypothetical protein